MIQCQEATVLKKNQTNPTKTLYTSLLRSASFLYPESYVTTEK